MKLDDFLYELPPGQIAQYPPAIRGESRLLILEGQTPRDAVFADLPSLLQPGDCLIFNDTRVIPARLLGRKASGGRIEVLIERMLNDHAALAHIRASKSPKPGTRLDFGGGFACRVIGRQEDLYEIETACASSLSDLMTSIGHLPLPPYIDRADEAVDAERYQTVYARRPGAVAAPTAGLHFNENLLAQLGRLGIEFGYVTLHVGAGTFQPVRDGDIAGHRMHREYVEVSAEVCGLIARCRQAGGRVIAVGTTSVRSLETAAAGGELAPFCGDTQLFITPGYRFRVIDALLTNFHLPGSTLLMLVAALAGHANVMAAYRHAVAAGYRFFSYGDAMWLTAGGD